MEIQPPVIEHRAVLRLNVESRGNEKLMRQKTDEILSLIDDRK